MTSELSYAAKIHNACLINPLGGDVLPPPHRSAEDFSRKRALRDLKTRLMMAVPQLQDYASDEGFPLHDETGKMMTALVDWCLLVDEELNR